MTAKKSQAKKLSTKQLVTIKKLYMEYKGPSEIAREFHVSRTTINWHITSNGWNAERKLSENEVFSSFDDSKKVDFIEMTQSTVSIMSRALKNLATRHDAPSMQEASRAADILKTLDNILRLDDGKPTDIVESSEKPISESELRERLKADPFSKANQDKKEEDETLS